MPWQTLLNAVRSAEGGTLEALGRAVRNALGIEPRAGVDRAAFTAAVVALAAKLSISDGVSLRIEEETFERLFHFEPDEAANVRWLFRLAAKDAAGFESYAKELARSLGDRPDLARDIFDALMHVATADGVLHEGEDRYLATVAEIFGYSPAKYRAIRTRFVHEEDDPYTAIGATRDMSNDALKEKYRTLVRKNHPDTLAGKGLPPEMQEIATRKLAAINAAWDAIAKERGL